MEQELRANSEMDNKIIRRQLLPWWIKIFCWLFMILGAGCVVGLIVGALGYTFALSIYGFETQNPLSLMGILICLILLYKGFTAYSLWFEKDYAINISKIDAVCGIVLCVISMFIMPFLAEEFKITIRLELLLLIPYYMKLNRIEYEWDNLESQ